MTELLEVPPRMLECTMCKKDIGLVPREVHKEKANTIRCANCQLDGRAEPRWMNEEGEEPEEEEEEEPESGVQCHRCGHTEFCLVVTETVSYDASEDPESETLWFDRGSGNYEDEVWCSLCGTRFTGNYEVQ
jgi:DNA-directed RNA polymerase subunit RPC12/RpoP